MKRILMTLLILMMVSSSVIAQSSSHKLKRGATNLFTGWVEIPKNIYEKSVEENLTTGITVGFIAGIGMAIVRTGSGLYEVVTFPFAVPENYAPVLEPEYVI